MCNIVAELDKAGMSDQWIMKNIGMDRDELLRLKQISGLADLFANREFSIPDEVAPTELSVKPYNLIVIYIQKLSILSFRHKLYKLLAYFVV